MFFAIKYFIFLNTVRYNEDIKLWMNAHIISEYNNYLHQASEQVKIKQTFNVMSHAYREHKTQFNTRQTCFTHSFAFFVDVKCKSYIHIWQYKIES